MPLFEKVGDTLTEKTYYVGFTFLMFEKEENFTWVLQMLLDLLNPKDNIPKVVVTAKDTTLMNVVATVFPKTTSLICHFHIGINVSAKCITNYKIKPKDVKDKKDKEVIEMNSSEVADNIMNTKDNVVEFL